MPIKQYLATKDATITNASSATGNPGSSANIGAADSLELFSLFTNTNENLTSKARILVQFPIEKIEEDLQNSALPAQNVKYFLRLFNVEHSLSVPSNFSASVFPVSGAWDEGYGTDLDTYSTPGWSNLPSGSGVTWKYRASGTMWTDPGGDYYNNYELTAGFDTGLEDIELDITNVVNDWLDNSLERNGLLVKLSGSFEYGSNKTYYTKRFSSRGTQYFYGRPAIEARWESPLDRRTNFYSYSPVCSTQDNTMDIYFYNRIGTGLKDIPGGVLPIVKIYNSASVELQTTSNTVSRVSKGIYKASIILNTEEEFVFDRWYLTGVAKPIFSGEISVNKREFDSLNASSIISVITNLKPKYSSEEKAKLKIFLREKNWQPNIYSKLTENIKNISLPNLYYKIYRKIDGLVILDYDLHTRCGSDDEGNYIDLDVSIFEPDYLYCVQLALKDEESIQELAETFKFRVE